MCLSKAFLEKDGEKELVLEQVSSVWLEGDIIRLKTLFGDYREITAGIKEIDFMTHRILLSEPAGN